MKAFDPVSCWGSWEASWKSVRSARGAQKVILLIMKLIFITFITNFPSLGGSNPLAPWKSSCTFENEGNTGSLIASWLRPWMSQVRAGTKCSTLRGASTWLRKRAFLPSPCAGFGSPPQSPPPPGGTVVISGDTEGLKPWTLSGREHVLPRVLMALAGSRILCTHMTWTYVHLFWSDFLDKKNDQKPHSAFLPKQRSYTMFVPAACGFDPLFWDWGLSGERVALGSWRGSRGGLLKLGVLNPNLVRRRRPGY